MKNKNEKGFALVLSLVLMIVMSLMGGALIIISSGDHASNNESDNYQQTFYVAETGLLEGERALLNEYMGPLQSGGTRDRAKRNFKGKIGAISFTIYRKRNIKSKHNIIKKRN